MQAWKSREKQGKFAQGKSYKVGSAKTNIWFGFFSSLLQKYTMISIQKSKTTKDQMTQKWLFSPCEPFAPTLPPHIMHFTVTFYFYSHLTSQLHGASFLYVDFILLVTWERRTRHWGNFNMKSFLFCWYISNESDKKRVLFILRNPRKDVQIKTLLILLCILKETMVNELWIMSLWYQAGRLSPRAGNSKLIAPCFRNILSLFTSSLYILLYHSLLISM